MPYVLLPVILASSTWLRWCLAASSIAKVTVFPFSVNKYLGEIFDAMQIYYFFSNSCPRILASIGGFFLQQLLLLSHLHFFSYSLYIY